MSSQPLGLSAEDLHQQDRWLRELVRRLVQESEVEDVVQETWVSALGVTENVERPEAWLTVVATNFVRRARRSVGLRVWREEDAARSEAMPSTEQTLELLELQQQVMDGVRALREPYRTAVLMRFTHGLSVSEIASRGGVSEVCVRQRLKRGLDFLRADVGARCGEDWRGMPALAFWLFPGVVEMKKTTWIVASAMVFVFAGSWAVWSGLAPNAAPTQEAFEKALVMDVEPSEPSVQMERMASEQRVPLASSAPLEAVDVATTYPFAGRVLSVSGEGLGGIDIAWTAEEPPGIPVQAIQSPAPVTSTAGDGSFQFTADVERCWAIPGSGWVTLAATYPILGSEQQELVVAREVQVAGTVTDSEGRPLEGVRIRFMAAELSEFGNVQDRLRRSEWRSSVTDGAGRFARANLPAAMGHLSFEKDGFVRGKFEVDRFGTPDARVTLEADQVEFVVTGWVYSPGGAAVEGALVGMAERSTRSGADGAFELRIPGDKAPNSFDTLWAAKPPWRTRQIKAVGGALTKEQDRALQYEIYFEGETLAIGGQVVSADGQPVEGITVYLWGQRELLNGLGGEELSVPKDRPTLDFGPELRVWSVTDQEGRFLLEGLGDLEYRLRLFDRERFAAVTSRPIHGGEQDVILTLPEHFVRSEITGRVVDHAGRGVPNVSITPVLGLYSSSVGSRSTLANKGFWRSFSTDEEGHFSVTEVGGGELTLTLDGKSILATSHPIDEDDPALDIEIVVEIAAHFRLVLTGERQAAAKFAVLDVDGREVQISAVSGNSTVTSRRRSIKNGRTRVLLTSGRAVTLVLYDDDSVELDSIPFTPRPGEVNVIDW